MVIGIGLNINETETDFPEPLRDKSTSLSIATGHSNQRELVCAIITTFFEKQWRISKQILNYGKIIVHTWMILFPLGTVIVQTKAYLKGLTNMATR